MKEALEDCVAFADFCIHQNITPAQLAELYVLRSNVSKAFMNMSATKETLQKPKKSIREKYEESIAALETKAKEYGFGIKIDNYLPKLMRGKGEINWPINVYSPS